MRNERGHVVAVLPRGQHHSTTTLPPQAQQKVEILVLEIGNICFKNQKFWDGGRYIYLILTL